MSQKRLIEMYKLLGESPTLAGDSPKTVSDALSSSWKELETATYALKSHVREMQTAVSHKKGNQLVRAMKNALRSCSDIARLSKNDDAEGHISQAIGEINPPTE